jgi:hypothetical protein
MSASIRDMRGIGPQAVEAFEAVESSGQVTASNRK